MSEKNKTIAKLKESGILKIGKGYYEKALKDFAEVLKLSPRDHQILLKAGDCNAKLNRMEEAVYYYDRAADFYTREGFVVKAIAANKLILKIKPDHPRIKERLSVLYEEKVRPKDHIASIVATQEKKKEEKPPRYELFSDLTYDEFVTLVEKMTKVDVKAGNLITREGDPGDSIFIIVSGEVKVIKEDKEGNEIWIANLSDGDFFGEFGFFARSKRNASVKTEVETTLLVLSRDNVESIIKEYPKVREVLINFYKERTLDTLIANSPMFSILKPHERSKLVSSFVLKGFKAGEVVLKQGEKGERMYFIQSGEVEVSTEKDGNVIKLARLKPGDFFGEVSIITGNPRTATVRAATDVRLMELTDKEIDEVIKAHPEIKDILNNYVNVIAEDTIATVIQYKNRNEESGFV